MNEYYFIEAGKEYCSSQEFDLAEELFKKAIEMNPENAEAYFELGKCYCIMNRFDRARDVLEPAVRLNPENPYARLLLGKSYKMVSEHLKARETLVSLKETGFADEDLDRELAEVEEMLAREGVAPAAETPCDCCGEESCAPAADAVTAVSEDKKNAVGMSDADPDRLPIETKGIRKDVPPYRACVTWLINNECNNRCSYCQNDFIEPEGFRILSPEEWYDRWKRLYDRYGTMAVQFTGGEPTIYPRFFEVMREVSRMHHVELQTNLSWDPARLIDNVPAHRVSRVGASFHQEYSEFDDFLAKMVRLKEAGFKVETTFVAYPPFIEGGKEFLRRSEEAGVPFSVLSFQGVYQGRRYPESYSDAERERLRELNLNIGNYAEAMMEWDVEHKVVVTKNEDKEEIDRRCRMGQMYAWLKPNGEAMRCCKSPMSLGNIIDGTFELLEDVLPCKLENCICWRSMMLGEEDRWAERWPGTKERAQD